MSKSNNKVEFELTKFNPNSIVDFSQWEQRQIQLVKDNPFINVVDRETYEIGRKRRTNLVTGRTDLQKERDAVKKELNRAKTFVAEKYDGFIAISADAEKRQQENVSVYEAQIQAEKDREALIAQERADGLRALIDQCEASLDTVIDQTNFDNKLEQQESFDAIIGSDDFCPDNLLEFNFLFKEMVKRQEIKFVAKAKEVIQDEQRRVEQLSIQQQAKINELYRQANGIIDAGNPNMVDEVKNVFTVDFEFGDHYGSFAETRSEMIAKAETRSIEVEKQAKEQAVHDHQNKVMAQSNRINEIGEGLLDRVFQLDVESTEKEIDSIRSEYQYKPETMLDEVVPAWDKMVKRVISSLTDKLEMIQMKRDQQQKERVRLEEIKNARWNSRKPRLIKMGFEHHVNEKMFRHPEFSVELSVETVFTNGDESWKLLMDDAVKQIKSIKESSAKEQKRQAELKDDKKKMTDVINTVIRIKNPEYLKNEIKNPELENLLQSIITELNAWCDAKIDQIEKF